MIQAPYSGRREDLIMRMMFSVDEISKMIGNGEILLLAGDEKLLAQLPEGSWIGGTIPYFMSEKGREITREKIFATRLPSFISKAGIFSYGTENISDIFRDAPSNGFSFIIIPYGSAAHLAFALSSPLRKESSSAPLVGWISGAMLGDLGKVTPKAFAGDTCGVEENRAVVMHVELPDDLYAEADILNIFDQGPGDEILFPETGFKTADAFINGKKQNFAEYLLRNAVDTHVPLVADYSGVMVNTSFQSVDAETGIVSFYAPVFRDVSYRHGQPFQDYEKEFILRVLRKKTDSMFFSCNCILNFLYYELKGRDSGRESSSIPFGDDAYREILSHLADRCNIFGPITFGEIANRLLNQTLAYLVIKDRPNCG